MTWATRRIPSHPLRSGMLLVWAGVCGYQVTDTLAAANQMAYSQPTRSTLTVEAGPINRPARTIVEVPCTLLDLAGTDALTLPADQAPCVQLTPTDGGPPVIGQWTPDKPSNVASASGTLVFRLKTPLPAGSARTYRTEAVASAAYPGARIVVRNVTGDGVTVLRGDRPVIKYNTGIVKSPYPDRPWQDRTAYAHPVWSPAGKVITDDFPPVHPQQRGLFIAWRRVQWGDHTGDFWALGDESGSMSHGAVERLVGGPVFGEFLVSNIGWLRDKNDGSQWPVLHERWHTRVYEVGDDAVLFDVWIRHEALDRDLKLPQYAYGGFTCRGSREWMKTKPVILTSQGRGRDGDNQPAQWCQLGGLVDGGTVSITLFAHPSNLRHPNLLRVHPDEPYVCFSIPKSGDFTIAVGAPLTLRYRVYVTDRLNSPADLDALHQEWINPPKVKLTGH
jgi:hypothetical protein